MRRMSVRTKNWAIQALSRIRSTRFGRYWIRIPFGSISGSKYTCWGVSIKHGNVTTVTSAGLPLRAVMSSAMSLEVMLPLAANGLASQLTYRSLLPRRTSKLPPSQVLPHCSKDFPRATLVTRRVVTKARRHTMQNILLFIIVKYELSLSLYSWQVLGSFCCRCCCCCCCCAFVLVTCLLSLRLLACTVEKVRRGVEGEAEEGAWIAEKSGG